MHALVLTQHDIAAPKYGGALRVSLLVDQLLKRGIRVSAIRFRPAGDHPSPADARLPIRDVIEPPGCSVAPVAALFHLASRAAERIAFAFDREERIDLIQSDPPWTALTGDRLARRLKLPHVLLAQNCESALAAQFAKTGPARRLPIVGLVASGFNVAVLRWAEKRTMAAADLALTPSTQDREEMASIGIATRRVEILPNGTRVRRLPTRVRAEMRNRLGLSPDTPVVVFVGRMDYPPNRDAAEAICAHIAPRCPGIVFLLVGSNFPKVFVPDNVVPTGCVDEVDGYLSASDLAIVPIQRGSGTRIKILDAWAAGLPVLSTPSGASGLVYRDGVDIVLEDDIRRFPDHILELFESPGRLAHLSQGAFEAGTAYRWDTIGERYTELLEALLRQTSEVLSGRI